MSMPSLKAVMMRSTPDWRAAHVCWFEVCPGLLADFSAAAAIFGLVPELLRPADMLGKDVGICVVDQAARVDGRAGKAEVCSVLVKLTTTLTASEEGLVTGRCGLRVTFRSEKGAMMCKASNRERVDEEVEGEEGALKMYVVRHTWEAKCC